MNVPRCQVLVLTCIDFRLHPRLGERLQRLGIPEFDLKTDAGGAKQLVSAERPEIRRWILENIGFARRIHGIERVLLVHHSDCLAYGGDAALGSLDAQVDLHRRELAKAAEILADAWPELIVEPYFAALEDGNLTLRKL